uniref:Uncharacterized protein n=1 Tax=Chelonoidis abingdonii TaxID=106734 RepID=A0A8C0IY81_CHEAB
MLSVRVAAALAISLPWQAGLVSRNDLGATFVATRSRLFLCFLETSLRISIILSLRKTLAPAE